MTRSDPGEGTPSRFPPWLKRPLPACAAVSETRQALRRAGLHTVCQSARCPNLGECYGRGTATFLVGGPVCTRNCRFCAVKHGAPTRLDPDEPRRVAEAVKAMRLSHVVITSVTRDDLDDGLAGHFQAVVAALRQVAPGVAIELLVPDFHGDTVHQDLVIGLAPRVFNHNLETVRRLSPVIRGGADHDRSLALLARAARAGRSLVKTGLLLGLGETRADLATCFREMADAGVRILTLGQYLRPGPAQMPEVRFLEEVEFEELAELARSTGIPSVISGSWVRSSYRAAEAAQVAGEKFHAPSTGLGPDSGIN